MVVKNLYTMDGCLGKPPLISGCLGVVESTHPRHSCPSFSVSTAGPNAFPVSVGDIIMSYFPQEMAIYGLAHTPSDHVWLSCCILWQSFWTAPVRPARQRRQRPSRSLSAQRRLQRSQTMDTTIAPPALNLGCAQEARWHSGGLGDILNLTFEVGKGVHGGHDRQLFFHCCDPHALVFGYIDTCPHLSPQPWHPWF